MKKLFIAIKVILLLAFCLFSATTHAQNTLALAWTPPSARINGTTLLLSEIGGYTIRYKQTTASVWVYITNIGPLKTDYTLSSIPQGAYDVQIAVYDINSVYSNYVTFTNLNPLAKPNTPSGATMQWK
jgi:hypothetical protein